MGLCACSVQWNLVTTQQTRNRRRRSLPSWCENVPAVDLIWLWTAAKLSKYRALFLIMCLDGVCERWTWFDMPSLTGKMLGHEFHFSAGIQALCQITRWNDLQFRCISLAFWYSQYVQESVTLSEAINDWSLSAIKCYSTPDMVSYWYTLGTPWNQLDVP